MNGCKLLGFRALCAGACGAGGSVPRKGDGPTWRYGDWNVGCTERLRFSCFNSVVDSVGVQSIEDDVIESVSSVSSLS
jgi:hypothetical protein